MRRLVSIAVVLAACSAGALLMGAAQGPSSSREYKIVFDNAFGLTEGGDFRVGGVNAGQTTAFEVTRDDPPKAVVTARIAEPGFDDFREDAKCAVKPQSLIGEYYVDCQPGSARRRLPVDGSGTVPVEQTESTIPQDLVNDIMRRPYRERLRLILTDLGVGVAGRPGDLQEVLRRAHPGLRETSKVLRILGDQNRTIEAFIRDADTVVGELEANKRDVARWVVETGNAAEISASRREDLRRTFKRLPRFLDELRPTMARLEDLADEQTPLLADARAAAPDLERFLGRLGPFAKASRPALRSLGDASLAGTRAFRRSSEEVRELRELAKDAGPTAKPLRQFLQTLDDRKRSTTKERLVAETVPPAPDKNSDPNTGKGGFTGMESLLNQFYWTTTAINSFDEVGHQLREIPHQTPCSDYSVKPNAELRAQCGNYLGSYLPGITHPDPTERGVAAAERREGRNPRRAEVSRRRGAGEPEAPALPGQRDISKPQVTLPPALEQLLSDIPRAPAPKGGADALPSPGSDTGQLLDYLLAP
jgi:ABC-type transporter Mla subunit MlaD